jgi:hypothetical protein
MKKYLIKIVIFILLLVAVDAAIGMAYSYVGSHPKGGDTARFNYINYGTMEDVLLFGSSRCMNHYNPCILEDSLQCSVYNCGTEGNGCLLSFIQLSNILDRYHPKMIVYDVMPKYDYLEGEDNTKYLGWARRFYGKPEIDSVFWRIDPSEKWKMLSKTYRNNAKCLLTLSDFVHPNHENIKGYRPLEAVMTYDKEPSDEDETKVVQVDSLKLEYLERFVKRCKEANVKFVFSVSPTYMKSRDVFDPVRVLAEKYQVPFLMHYQDSDYVGHKELFKDATHMNRVGAERYSSTIANELKTLCVVP